MVISTLGGTIKHPIAFTYIAYSERCHTLLKEHEHISGREIRCSCLNKFKFCFIGCIYCKSATHQLGAYLGPVGPRWAPWTLFSGLETQQWNNWIIPVGSQTFCQGENENYKIVSRWRLNIDVRTMNTHFCTILERNYVERFSRYKANEPTRKRKSGTEAPPVSPLNSVRVENYLK